MVKAVSCEVYVWYKISSANNNLTGEMGNGKGEMANGKWKSLGGEVVLGRSIPDGYKVDRYVVFYTHRQLLSYGMKLRR